MQSKIIFSGIGILGIILMTISVQSQSKSHSLKSLRMLIDSTIQSSEGNFAVAFKDIKTDRSLFINAKESFHAASTMKTPVMIEVFRQAKFKKFNLSDSIIVKNEFLSIMDGSPFTLDISSDSDDSLYSQIGKPVSIRKLLHSMIAVSSNLATNLLIQKVGAMNVQKTMKNMNAADIHVLRGVEDEKAFQAGKNNTVTAFDLMILFEAIAKGKAVNQQSSKDMIDILLQQRFNERIPGLLPPGIKVAHKTGSITGVQHDSGIVFLPDGRKYVIILLSKDLPDAKKGIGVLANISKMIYDYEVH